MRIPNTGPTRNFVDLSGEVSMLFLTYLDKYPHTELAGNAHKKTTISCNSFVHTNIKGIQLPICKWTWLLIRRNGTFTCPGQAGNLYCILIKANSCHRSSECRDYWSLGLNMTHIYQRDGKTIKRSCCIHSWSHMEKHPSGISLNDFAW